MTAGAASGRAPVLTYGSLTLLLVLLGLASLALADLHVAALHPWAEMARLGAGFLDPDFAAVGFKAVVLTVAFAVLGVGLGSLAGLALCLVFARSRFVRVLAAGLRSIHELFWALILIQITGLSPLTGILAVALPYAGIFAKVYAETIEEADLAAERVLPSGTSLVARFAYARLPPLADAFRSYTLYRLECGLRSTLVLGFVGLPTVGFDLESYFAEGHYREAAALILVFYALIATRGLWARAATLPFLVAGSIGAMALLTDRVGGQSIGTKLARFGMAIVPEPLRRGGLAGEGMACGSGLAVDARRARDRPRRRHDARPVATRDFARRLRVARSVSGRLAAVHGAGRPHRRARRPDRAARHARLRPGLYPAAARRAVHAAGDPRSRLPQWRHRRLPDGTPCRRLGVPTRRPAADRPLRL